MSIRIVIADDYPPIRQVLRNLLEIHSDFEVLGEAGDGKEAVTRCLELVPDLAMMDVHMPGLNGVEATQQIVRRHPQIGVLAVSSDADYHLVWSMLMAGASGYVLKDAVVEELVDAARRVAAGRTYLSAAIRGQLIALLNDGMEPLSQREERVLRVLTGGNDVADTSMYLKLDPKTLIETHRNLLKKILASDVADLVAHILRDWTSHG